MTAATASRTARVGLNRQAPDRPLGVAWVVASEGFASGIGFVSLSVLARRLGPDSFAGLEFAMAVSAWLLVLVRGGFDVVAYREAARRPRLVAAWTGVLLGLRLAAAVVGYAIVLCLAARAGGGRGWVLAVAGLSLFPPALAADVGPRATGRLVWVAVAQAARASAYLAAVLAFVRGPEHAARAAACVLFAETVSALIYGVRAIHRRVAPDRCG